MPNKRSSCNGNRYEIGSFKKYVDRHTFRIFTIDEIKQCCENVDLVVKKVYENYDVNKLGSSISKNLQFLICKAFF